MELIKDIIRQFYPLLIMCACVSFVVYVFFSANYNGGAGIFENTGNIYAPMIEDDELKQNGLNYIVDEVNAYVPEIQYNSGVKEIGDCVHFRNLFLVQLEDETLANGDIEDGFALYLLDIKNQSGNSVLERMTSEEIDVMEEIPAAFVYDKENDLLYIYGSGTYTVEVKVYGASGATQTYEFNLPVEVS